MQRVRNLGADVAVFLTLAPISRVGAGAQRLVSRTAPSTPVAQQLTRSRSTMPWWRDADGRSARGRCRLHAAGGAAACGRRGQHWNNWGPLDSPAAAIVEVRCRRQSFVCSTLAGRDLPELGADAEPQEAPLVLHERLPDLLEGAGVAGRDQDFPLRIVRAGVDDRYLVKLLTLDLKQL